MKSPGQAILMMQFDELGKNLDELERYKKLLDRKSADIFEDLIKSSVEKDSTE